MNETFCRHLELEGPTEHIIGFKNWYYKWGPQDMRLDAEGDGYLRYEFGSVWDNDGAIVHRLSQLWPKITFTRWELDVRQMDENFNATEEAECLFLGKL